MTEAATNQDARIPVGSEELLGTLRVPKGAPGLVVLAQGSGSGPRGREFASALAESLGSAGLGTFQVDLLSGREAGNRGNYFDIPRLGQRLILVSEWLRQHEALAEGMSLGYFCSGTAGGASLWAAAEAGDRVAAVACLEGRPDLATSRLREVASPVLFLCDGEDEYVEEMNRQALIELCNARLLVLPASTNPDTEKKGPEEFGREAAAWFHEQFSRRRARTAA